MIVECDHVECVYNTDCKCTADKVKLVHTGFDHLECETFPYSSKLKKCPNCGNWNRELYHVYNPLAFWDGDMRGEDKWTAVCWNCGLNISRERPEEAIEDWNDLPRREEYIND